MNGKFTGTYRVLALFIAVVGMIVICIGLFGVDKEPLAAVCVILVTICIVIPAGLMLTNMPGEYSADELGFTITMLRKKHRFRYREIESVTCEYLAPDRYGNAYVELTVKKRSGETEYFTENCQLQMQDIMNDPDGEKPQLVRLCDYVNQAKEAAV
ncbi:MAG: hypothetical protein K6B74_10355 [Ruminococcus sp.]|nr:hypothetical protein [Ruminococcus sp.]